MDKTELKSELERAEEDWIDAMKAEVQAEQDSIEASEWLYSRRNALMKAKEHYQKLLRQK